MIKQTDLQMLELLVDNNVKIDDKIMDSLLEDALLRSNFSHYYESKEIPDIIKMIKLLNRSGFDFFNSHLKEYSDEKPLMIFIALKNNSLEIAQALVDAGANLLVEYCGEHLHEVCTKKFRKGIISSDWEMHIEALKYNL